MNTELVTNEQNDLSIALRQKTFPFRLRTYGIALLISVILCSVPPLLVLLLYAISGITQLLIANFSFVFIVASIGFLFWGSQYWNSFDVPLIPFAICAAFCLICSFELISVIASDLSDWLDEFYKNYYIYLWAWVPVLFTIIYGIYSLVFLCIMKIIDWHPRRRNIRYICPNENCGYVGNTFAYKCPHCNGALNDLYPSFYGILYTRCPHCDRYASSSWLTGRNKYSHACPNCQNLLTFNDFGNYPESVFIVEGSSKSGKTSLLMQMLAQWSSHFPDQVSFSIDEQKSDVMLLSSQMDAHVFCSPTARLFHPGAFVMKYKKAVKDYLAYFYDTGGMFSSSVEPGMTEPYYNLANGVFLVIDPWAEGGILTAFGRKKKNLRYSKYQFVSQDADAAVSRLCCKLEHLYPESISAGFKIPICVVVTKCDLNGLNKTIGSDEHFTQSSVTWEEQSKKVEEFLVKHDMYNFVNVVKTRFKKNAFFAVSVLKNSESVLNPLLWMTSNV